MEVLGPLGTFSGFSLPSGNFSISVDLASNKINKLYVTAIGEEGSRSTPVPAVVIHDDSPPLLYVDEPTDGAAVFEQRVTVTGRVADVLTGYLGMQVDVNRMAANVLVGVGAYGTYERGNVELSLGENEITVAGSDVLGNTVQRTIRVIRLAIDPTRPVIVEASGNLQQATVGTQLAQPLVVTVTRADGSAFAGKLVEFRVIRSDGTLSTASGSADRTRSLHVRTDAEGIARAFWTVGSDAGCGNNRLVVESAGAQGKVLFCASASPGVADRILVAAGGSQRSEVSGPAPELLSAFVSDGYNGLQGVPVTFTVRKGTGKIDGLDSVTIETTSAGHAEASFFLGPEPGNQVVEATFPGNSGVPVEYTVFGVTRDPSRVTRVTGIVLDNSQQPIQGVRCMLQMPSWDAIHTSTDLRGRFSFEDVPGSGVAFLIVDGATAIHVGGEGGSDVAPGSFPWLGYQITVVPNAENTLTGPVLLPPLDPDNAVLYDGTKDIELKVRGIEGLKMRVTKGSMRLRDGTVPTPQRPTWVSLNQVHADDVPMPAPNGVTGPFAWTLQPSLSTFDPPVEVQYPNTAGLPPGATAYCLSFNHDTDRFDVAASGYITDDGLLAVSDPESGISVAGWGWFCGAINVNGDCEPCEGNEDGCCEEECDDNNECTVDMCDSNGTCAHKPMTPQNSTNGCGPAGSTVLTPEALNCFNIYSPLRAVTVCFANACDRHDACWAECGNPAGPCDLGFYSDVNQACLQSGLTPPELITCTNIAAIYAISVVIGGQIGNYCEAQRLACRCANAHPPEGCGEGQGSGGGVNIDLPFEDADADLMPDSWEEEVNLDPSNIADALQDPDSDGLVNIIEYIQSLDPFDLDSLRNGKGDMENVRSIQPKPTTIIDGTWTLSVNGQSVQANPDGTFRIPNIIVADNATSVTADGVSDNSFRLTGVSLSGETPQHVYSECFRIRRGETYRVKDLTITDALALARSMAAAPLQATLAGPGAATRMRVLAEFPDGVTDDISASECTTYSSSNTRIAAVDRDGVVTAVSPGTAFITASAEGTASVARLSILSVGVDLTTIEGIVILADGRLAPVATVTLDNLSAVTNSEGAFGLTIQFPSDDRLILKVQKVVDGVVYVGHAIVTSFRASGVTDVGLVVIDKDTDADGLGDWYEVNVYRTDAAREDSDSDGLRDGTEVLELLTNAVDSDTDDDGWFDSVELEVGADPLDQRMQPRVFAMATGGSVPAAATSPVKALLPGPNADVPLNTVIGESARIEALISGEPDLPMNSVVGTPPVKVRLPGL